MLGKKRELSVKSFLLMMWSHKLVIIGAAIVCTLLGYVYAAYLQTPSYTASGVLYVSGQVSGPSEDINRSDIDVSRTLTSTFIEIMNGRSFLSTVSNDIEGKYTWDQIRNMISIYAKNSTELLSVSVTTSSPQDSYDIAQSILRNAPDKIHSVIKGGSVEVVDEVVMPTVPSSAGLGRILILCFAAGVVLGVLAALLIELFDTRIRKVEDLTERYEISVIGEILS